MNILIRTAIIRRKNMASISDKKFFIIISLFIIFSGVLLSFASFYLNGRKIIREIIFRGSCLVDGSYDENKEKNKDIFLKKYKTISGALTEGCEEINISEGIYKENIFLEEESLKGSDKEKSVIEGKITIKGDVEISELTIDGGIEIDKYSDVKIYGAVIRNSVTGIDVAGGKLRISGSMIESNGKGMYLRKETNIYLSDSKVQFNKEEGIDMRNEVEGNIIGNEISQNGESGIEVIVGNSNLNILENTINKNLSSGIAAQYYTDFNFLGNLEIRENEIGGNIKYGLDCKAPSGGKGRPKGYWAGSIGLSENRISGNNEKNFASACKLDDQAKNDAIKSGEERELEIKELMEKDNLTLSESERLEVLKKYKERIAAKEQKETELKNEIYNIFEELEKIRKEDKILKREIESANPFFLILVKSNRNKIEKIIDMSDYYREKSEILEEKATEILDKSMLKDTYSKAELAKDYRYELDDFLREQGARLYFFNSIFK